MKRHRLLYNEFVFSFATFAWISVGACFSNASVANPVASSLTVYSYPAHIPLDWSTPSGLLKSFADIATIREMHLNHDVKFTSDYGDPGDISSYYVSTMGHSLNHINCALPDGSVYDQWVSYSGDNFTSLDFKNAVVDQIGMGTILYDYVDGYLMTGPENVDRLIYNRGTQGASRYVQFEVNKSQCLDLKNMIDFFHSFYYKPSSTLAQLEARPPEKISYYNTEDSYYAYQGRLQDPTFKVGSGCAPFSAGLVREIGKYDKYFEMAWRRPVTISNKLIGQKNADGKMIYKVPIADILAGPLSKQWTYPDVGNQFVSMYDPTLIWSFISDVSACLTGSTCDSDTQAWIKSNNHVEVGSTQVFSNTIMVPVPGSRSNPVQTEPETTSVQIDGIVIRN